MTEPVNPLALLQSRLGTMIGVASGYVDTLPKPMKRRIKALKKLQLESLEVDAELAKEVHKLEIQFAKKYDEIWAKRREIITGKYEPTDEECDFPSPAPSDDESSDIEDKVEGQKKNADKQGDEVTDVAKGEADSSAPSELPAHGFTEDTPGIPEFWLTIFKNIESIGVNIQEHDEPILANLTDITLKQSMDPLSFTLEFHFAANEYFTNSVLTKTYELSCEIDSDDPFSFEGMEIKSAKGCKIDWKEGKNVTVKTVTKKQKHKTKGSIRCVPKVVKADSFFNFFDPIILPEDDDENSIDEETTDLLQADLEIGELIKQRIIPRAVLYFTGEALEEDDDDDYEDEEDDEEEDDDEDDEDDESGDNEAGNDKKKHVKMAAKSRKAGGTSQEQCPQQ